MTNAAFWSDVSVPCIGLLYQERLSGGTSEGYRMRIKINRAECQGHARCAAVAGALFVLDDRGYISSDGFDVPAGQEALARAGAKACPERVITVVETTAEAKA